jgi:hypothetical protein
MKNTLYTILSFLFLPFISSCEIEIQEDIINTFNILESTYSIQERDIIEFGNYKWVVLEVNDRKSVLIITENIINTRSFHETWVEVTWENSDLRAYLNNDFIKTFTEEERKHILSSNNTSYNNKWFGTKGGNNTTDQIFLLNIEEVVKYFGDSGLLMNPPPRKDGVPVWLLSDEYNSNRISLNLDNYSNWWWLRSSGFDIDFSSFISEDGTINLSGKSVIAEGGIRPVLLLNYNFFSY